MTAPLREQLKNDAFTTLNGGIDSDDSPITVTDGSVFPSTGNFRIRIGDEILICTARSGNSLTVLRGQEGSTPASASNGADVIHILTAGGLTRWAQDNEGLWGYSGSPPVGKLVADDGSTILTSADWTWVNQGSSTISDQNGTMLMRIPAASGENVRALVRTAPSASYSYIAAVQGVAIKESVQQIGIGLRQSSSGKMMVLNLLADNNHPKRISVYRMASATSFTSTASGFPVGFLHVGKYVWLKIEDDNTNLKFYISFDGIEFIQVFSESRTSHMTTTGPDQMMFQLNNQGSTNFQMLGRLCHWSRLT